MKREQTQPLRICTVISTTKKQHRANGGEERGPPARRCHKRSGKLAERLQPLERLMEMQAVGSKTGCDILQRRHQCV